MARSEELAGKGHTRSALTESITALEIATFEFAARPRAEEFLVPSLRGRIGVASLKREVERLGMTCAIKYLLPTLLPETLISTDVFRGVEAALMDRQNVVHNGQREVPRDRLAQHLKHVRQFCASLQAITGEGVV